MASYPAPTHLQGNIFNPSAWIQDMEESSQSGFLKYPLAQGSETLNGMINLGSTVLNGSLNAKSGINLYNSDTKLNQNITNGGNITANTLTSSGNVVATGNVITPSIYSNSGDLSITAATAFGTPGNVIVYDRLIVSGDSTTAIDCGGTSGAIKRNIANVNNLNVTSITTPLITSASGSDLTLYAGTSANGVNNVIVNDILYVKGNGAIALNCLSSTSTRQNILGVNNLDPVTIGAGGSSLTTITMTTTGSITTGSLTANSLTAAIPADLTLTAGSAFNTSNSVIVNDPLKVKGDGTLGIDCLATNGTSRNNIINVNNLDANNIGGGVYGPSSTSALSSVITTNTGYVASHSYIANMANSLPSSYLLDSKVSPKNLIGTYYTDTYPPINNLSTGTTQLLGTWQPFYLDPNGARPQNGIYYLEFGCILTPQTTFGNPGHCDLWISTGGNIYGRWSEFSQQWPASESLYKSVCAVIPYNSSASGAPQSGGSASVGFYGQIYGWTNNINITSITLKIAVRIA